VWPASWETILLSDVAFYRSLRPRERERFRASVARFVHNTRVVGIDVEVNDRVRLLVAASACRLTLNLPGETFGRLRVVEVQRTSFNHHAHHGGFLEVLGTAELHRVVIALDTLAADLLADGEENVGYHEFAHVLDASDGITDGVPPLLHDPSLRHVWDRVMSAELARLRTALETGEPTLFDDRAQKSVIELFAYATEAFFGMPEKLRADYAELHALLSTYYAQDPIRARARSAASGGEGSDRAALYTRDIVADARRGCFDPLIGRAIEARRLLHILERRFKNHPLLVGEPGVGKTALIRGFADRIAHGDVPSRLARAQVLELDTGALLAGANLRTDIKDRLKSLIARLRAVPDAEAILVVEDFDALFGEQGSGVVELLKPLLQRGEIHLLATTTPEGVRRINDRDAGILRWFSTVTLDAPSIEQATEVLRGVAAKYGEHHGVRIAEGAIVSAVALAKRYLSDRALPGAAIELLDETSARKRIELDSVPAEGAAARSNGIGKDDVALTLESWTRIPVSRMLEGEAEKLLKLEERLARRVVGQEEAVRAIARAVRRGRGGLSDPGKPIGSFLFLGPSGCGKTELAKALAELLFDDEQALTRMDMSEFMERHMVHRLIGSPQGYADSQRGGMLTEAARRRPYSVLLFDEVEKAHADVLNLLLQVLDAGRLTDGRGRLADFSNTVVIMTSNTGSKRILEADPKLFGTEEGREAIRDLVLEELKGFFLPELLSRIDDVVVFKALSKEDLRGVVDIQLKRLERLLSPREIKVSLTDGAKLRLVDLGFEPSLGARPLKRAILRELQNPLAEAILAGGFAPGTMLRVDVDGAKKLTFAKA
jgi:ATP-dependent Clp protease ATP-binding subunit ClpA